MEEPSPNFFFDAIWNDFDPVLACQFLLDFDEGFFGKFGIKPAVAAGLRAWIVAPDDSHFRKCSVATQVLKELISLEERGRSARIEELTLSDVYFRVQQPGVSEFYRSVYYPIGGLKSIAIDHSVADFSRLCLETSKHVSDCADMMHLVHWHQENLISRDFRPSSVAKISELLAEIRQVNGATGRRSDDRQLRTEWSRFKPSAALIYAAANIMVKDNVSLLSLLQEGGFTWQEHRSLFRKFVGMAVYIHHVVDGSMYKNQGGGARLQDLTGVEAVPFTSKSLLPRDADRIRRSFRR